MVAETGCITEQSSESGYFRATPNPRALGTSNFIAKLVILGARAHLFTLKRQEWQRRDKYLNSGRLKCCSD